jgi:ribosomal protein S18 acetylase RimI-like enzyme
VTSAASTDQRTYRDSLEGISTSQLEGFFVGWPHPLDAATHERILKGSTHFVLAFDEVAQRVVGFVNCISDGVLSAYIPLLEVLPSYQHRGIGTHMVELLLLKTKEAYMVDLCCDESLTPFYEKLGFKRSTGMVIRNYKKLADR